MTLRVLVVEGDARVSGLAKALMRVHPDLEVRTSRSGQEALYMLCTERLHVVFYDLAITDLPGLHFIKEVKRRGLEALVVLIADHLDPEVSAEAVRSGAYRCLTRPVALADLQAVLEHAAQRVRRPGQ